MSEWSLRLARPDDAEAFHWVEEDAAQLLVEEPSLAGIPVPPSRSADEYRTMIKGRHCLAATSGERVVGFAAARRIGREVHLHELSVACDFQRKRIGATLLHALKIDAHNSGIRAITLHTYRDIPWNAPFYEQHGFVIVEDLDAYPRLAAGQDAAVELGLPAERRCAMIHFLD
ncbi:MAG: GNAT family N-acetyltransferase [Pseudomonadota bacterium]